MNDPSPKVQEKSCMALEAFSEHLGDGIRPYLQPLMEKLVLMLQHGNLKTQETVVCAIGSAAHSAGKVNEYLDQRNGECKKPTNYPGFRAIFS